MDNIYEKEYKKLVEKLVRFYNYEEEQAVYKNDADAKLKRDVLHKILLGNVFDRPELVTLNWATTAAGYQRIVIKWPNEKDRIWWDVVGEKLK